MSDKFVNGMAVGALLGTATTIAVTLLVGIPILQERDQRIRQLTNFTTELLRDVREAQKR